MLTLTRTTTEERRHLPLSTAGVAVLRTTDGDAVAERFTGHAAVFNTRTAIGNPLRWGFYEEIAPGAFTKTLGEGDVRMLIDHDSYYVVSRVSAGSLLLAEDDRGLAVDSALDTGLSYVGDLKSNVRNKNITGMSFGFYVIKDDWTMETVELSDGTSTEVEVRRILEVRLIEVSAVTFPAYEDTDAELASVASALAHRGDAAAIERRAAFRPELGELLQRLAPADQTTQAAAVPAAAPSTSQEGAREPAESTREAQPDAEPAVSTRPALSTVSLRMRAHAARWGLPH